MQPVAYTFDIGILGGGQLARMSIQAAQRMGVRCLSLDPGEETPASQIAPAIRAPLGDVEALKQMFMNCYRVTLENEFVPARAVRQAMEEVGREPEALIPGLECLETVQDKLLQREAYAKAGAPSPKAVAIEDDGATAVAKIGFPMMLKKRFGGYDGKGTRIARNPDDFEDLRGLWSNGGWLAEEFVEFKREVAVMVMRWIEPPYDPLAPFDKETEFHGMVGCFPTVETVQKDHVCDLVFPAGVDASEVAIRAVLALDGFGLFGVELFEKADGSFVVNETAPRPHNSGHYTLDWGGPSQFDQHVRITLGLPPAPFQFAAPTCMANLFGRAGAGDFRRGIAAVLAGDPGIRFHWYGKSDTRPGRKLGHLNAVGEDAVERAVKARERFYSAWASEEVEDIE
jgi:5-(carboxyamino)imidazole ribonucleotide synthase